VSVLRAEKRLPTILNPDRNSGRVTAGLQQLKERREEADMIRRNRRID
jgi:hypothetical protein